PERVDRRQLSGLEANGVTAGPAVERHAFGIGEVRRIVRFFLGVSIDAKHRRCHARHVVVTEKLPCSEAVGAAPPARIDLLALELGVGLPGIGDAVLDRLALLGREHLDVELLARTDAGLGEAFHERSEERRGGTARRARGWSGSWE